MSEEKKLIIYKDSGDFVVKRVNQFGTPFVRRFISEEGLSESLKSYRDNWVLDEYEIVVEDKSIWPTVINALRKK